MFGRLLLLLLPSIAFCFDAVVWSSGDAINRASPPELSKLIESATLEKPLVLFVLKNFQLADFSRHANVYGEPSKATKGLKKWIATSKGYAAEWLDEAAQLPAGSYIEYKGELSALTEQPVVVVNVESFAVIDDLADNILQSLDRPYTAVLTGEDALTTHAIKKRVSVDDPRGKPFRASARDSGNANTKFPLVLPNNVNGSTCLLYIGGIGLQVFRPNDKDNKLSSMWVDAQYDDALTNVKCWNETTQYSPNATATFKIVLNPNTTATPGGYKVNALDFTLTVTRYTGGYWSLSKIDIDKLDIANEKAGAPVKSITDRSGNSTAQHMKWDVNSVDGYSYACSVTPPAWIIGLMVDGTDVTTMRTNDPNKVQVGLVLKRFQLQPAKINRGMFGRNVDDCVPTFSAGSWMGILVGLVFLGGFLFAMSMLNSVQTMDRFDDPKQKQIIINFKE